MVDLTFTGEYEHRLDDRGRIAIPAEFRDEFLVPEDDLSEGEASKNGREETRRGYVLLGPDNQVELHTIDGFGRMVERRVDADDRSEEARKLQRAVARAHKIDIDRQGRVTIPQRIRDQAGLVGAAKVIGVFDHLEVWSADDWEVEEQRLDESYTDLLQGLAQIADANVDGEASS